MLKLLLKKQLLEIFRSYYYDAKKNKARSKAATIAYIAMFAVLSIRIWRTVRLGFKHAEGSWKMIWAFLRICFKAFPFKPEISSPSR